MPIAFSCASCSANFRVPDTMAGKKVRCPKCQAVQQVPSAELEPEIEYQVKANDDDFWAQTAGAAPLPASNPFESPDATPTRTGHGYSEREACNQVAVPGTVLYLLSLAGVALSVVGLGISLLLWIGMPGDVSAAQRAGNFVGSLILVSLTYATSQGANNLRNLREPGSVWFALFMSMLPCGTHVLCPAAIPFALWGIMLMCDRRITAHFRG